MLIVITMLLTPSAYNALLSTSLILLLFYSSNLTSHDLWHIIWIEHHVSKNQILESTPLSETTTINTIVSYPFESSCVIFASSSSLYLEAYFTFYTKKNLGHVTQFLIIETFHSFLINLFFMMRSPFSFRKFRPVIIFLLLSMRPQTLLWIIFIKLVFEPTIPTMLLPSMSLQILDDFLNS